MDLKTRSVLVLNADFTVLSTTTLQQALKKCFLGIFEVVKTVGNRVVVPWMDVVGIPVVVRMVKYIYIPFSTIKLNRKHVLMRDDFQCQYCGKSLSKDDSTIDHVVPKSRRTFPGNIWTNLVACCRRCNHEKDNRTPEEAGMRLIRKPEMPRSKILRVQEHWREFVEGI